MRQSPEDTPVMQRLSTLPIAMAILVGLALAGGGPAATQRFESGDAPTLQWTKLDPRESPPGDVDGPMVFDAGRGELVLVAIDGPTFGWNGSTWRELDDFGGNAGVNMAYDETRQEIVRFGGMCCGSQNRTLYDQTFVFRDGAWVEVFPPTRPPARAYHAMAYDPVLGEVILFGGRGSNPSRPRLDDTWAFDGSTWRDLRPAHSPTERTESAMAYDGKRGQLVMFGGEVFTDRPRRDCASRTLCSTRATWTWDGTDWSRLDLDRRPPGRSSRAMTPVDGRPTLYGGYADDGGRLFDTWVLGRQRWHRIADAGAASRSSGSLAWDDTRNEAIFLADTGAAPSETWRLSRTD